MFKRLLSFISIVSVLFLTLSVGASALSDCVDLNNLSARSSALDDGSIVGTWDFDEPRLAAYMFSLEETKTFYLTFTADGNEYCSIVLTSGSTMRTMGFDSASKLRQTVGVASNSSTFKWGLGGTSNEQIITVLDGDAEALAFLQATAVKVSSGSSGGSGFPSLSDMPWNASADWTGEVLSVVDETNSLFRFSRDFQLIQDENFSLEGSYLIWGEKDNLVSVPRPLMTLPNWAQSSVNLRFSYRVEYELDGAAKILELPVDTTGKLYCWLGTSDAGTVEWTEQASVLSFSGSSLSLPSLSSGRLQKIDLDNLADVLGWSGEIKAVCPEISLPDGATVVSEGFSVSLNVSLSFYASSADDWISSFPVAQWINYDLVFPDFSGVGSTDDPDDFMASLKDDHDVLLVASVFGQMLSWSLIKSFVLIVLALALVKFIIVG